jgi:hypothetical protein
MTTERLLENHFQQLPGMEETLQCMHKDRNICVQDQFNYLSTLLYKWEENTFLYVNPCMFKNRITHVDLINKSLF